jgi:hypothetical protein
MRLELANCDVVRLPCDSAQESIDDGAGLLTHVGNGTTDNAPVTSPRRFPDLTGKAVIAVGAEDALIEITRHLAANHMLIAVVSRDRDVVRQSVEIAESLAAVVNGFTVDPADPSVWQRIAPHIEQRLGPIDIVICGGAADVRTTVASALVPDMKARHRGVLIEIGADNVEPLGDGVRHHTVDADLDPSETAAAAVRLASDGPDPPSNGPESTVRTAPNG